MQNELEIAAMNFGAARYELRSVIDCNMPDDFVHAIQFNADAAAIALIDAAEAFYNNHFDGAES